MKLDCVERLVSAAFGHLGLQVVKKPKTFVAIPLLLTVLLSSGLLRMKYTKDAEYLYSPVNGEAKHERWVVETLFPMNYSLDADVSRLTKMTGGVLLFAEAKDGTSIFDKDVFADLKRLDETIRNMTVVWEGKEWKYTNLCAKKYKKCFKNEILNFENRLDDMANGKYSIEYPLYIMDEQNYKIFFSGAFLGGVEINKDNKIKSARAAMLAYFLDINIVPNEMVVKWENEFLKMIEETEFEHLNIGYSVSNTVDDELDRVIFSTIPYFMVAFVLMITFSVCTCSMLDSVRSKPWLGMCGCFSSTLAVAAAFGFAMHCGVVFASINFAGPFLMIGIGMDNTFVLLASWRKTDYRLSVEERMSAAYKEAGVSITITSLTNFISFLVGMITPFPALRIFCIYTGLSILFTFIYQVTFFGGCMTINGRAEKKNLHGLFCIKATPKSLSENKSVWYRLFCTGGNNPDDPDNPMDNGENFFMVFCRDKLGASLNKKSVKFTVIVLFLAYLSIAIWSCTNIKEGLDLSNMVRYDSYAVKYFSLRDRYFAKYRLRIQLVINETLDYSDPKVQDEVENVIHKLENMPMISGPRFTESWLRIYKSLLSNPRTEGLFHGLNMSKKLDFYEGITQVFFRISKNYFKQDIKFNDDNTEITATRFVLQSENVWSTNDEKDLVINLREVLGELPWSVTAFHMFFIYVDSYIVIKDVAIQAVCVATAVMMLITFIFIPIPSCALWVAFSILSIEIGIVGYMSLWGVSLDMISTLNLILCIGFSVDYSAHITYAYISSGSTDPKEKLKKALHSLGLPIVQGCISTTIGVLVLALTPSYTSRLFMKAVLLVITFGAIHGLLLLPVLLSLTDCLFRGKKSKEHAESPPPYRITPIDVSMLETVGEKATPPSYWTLPEAHLASVMEEHARDSSTSSAVQSNGQVEHDKEINIDIKLEDTTETQPTCHAAKVRNRNRENNGGADAVNVLRTSGDRADFVNPAFEE